MIDEQRASLVRRARAQAPAQWRAAAVLAEGGACSPHVLARIRRELGWQAC